MRLWTALLVVPALLASGCMSPEARLVGKWQGSLNVSGQTPFGKLPSGFASLADPQLDLRPNKTFTLYLAIAPIDGTWKLQDKEVILTPSKVGGMSSKEIGQKAEQAMEQAQEHSPMPFPFGMMGGAIPGTQEMHVKILNEGNTLTLDPAAGTLIGGMGKITFKKI